MKDAISRLRVLKSKFREREGKNYTQYVKDTFPKKKRIYKGIVSYTMREFLDKAA